VWPIGKGGGDTSRNGVRQFSAKIELTNPIWCPGAAGNSALTYADLKLTLYGDGEKIDGNTANRHLESLRAMVGDQHLQARSYRQELRDNVAACQVGRERP
jgi:hypothetical protein